MNQFAIGYMINPSIKFKNAFRTQVEKYLSVYFSTRTTKTIKDCLMKNNTCVMALIMINENDGYTPKTLYRVLSCVVYSLIANYFCIDYLSCQSKILSSI